MQAMLIENIDSFFIHLADNRLLPAHLVIAECFRNNYDMLMNEKKIGTFAEVITEKLSKVPEEDYIRC